MKKPQRNGEKLEELSTLRLSIIFALLSGFALWCPSSIYSGCATGAMLVPLCRWDCYVSLQNPAGFAGATAMWLVFFILAGLAAAGFALALWRRWGTPG